MENKGQGRPWFTMQLQSLAETSDGCCAVLVHRPGLIPLLIVYYAFTWRAEQAYCAVRDRQRGHHSDNRIQTYWVGRDNLEATALLDLWLACMLPECGHTVASSFIPLFRYSKPEGSTRIGSSKPSNSARLLFQMQRLQQSKTTKQR